MSVTSLIYKSNIFLILFFTFFKINFIFAGGFLPTGHVHQKNTLKVIQVAAGGDHNCVILENGSVKCWGRNNYGQLGQGDISSLGDDIGEMNNSLPVVNLGTNRTAVQIVAGTNHTCVLLDNSSIKCWGYNFYGQLGQGNTNNLGDDAGEMGDSLLVINLGTNRTAVQIVAGTNHTCVLLDNSSIKCWGYNFNGQLGQGNTNNLGDGPGEMGDSLSVINLGTNLTVVQVTAGNGHTCALLSNSLIKCWGSGSRGKLGQGNLDNLGDNPGEMGDSLPVINLGTSRTAIQISAGANHNCAILDNGLIKCWGYNFFGQLGAGNNTNLGDTPGEMGDSLLTVNLGTNRTVVQISTNLNHSCALLENSGVKCWGDASGGVLGQGNSDVLGDDPGEISDSLPAISLGTNRKAIQISAGNASVCAILNNGSLKCWGENSHGQLGRGDTTYAGSVPGEMGDNLKPIKLGTAKSRLAKIMAPSNNLTSLSSASKNKFKQIAVGYNHTCAILDRGAVKCWGLNSNGELGQGNVTNLGLLAGQIGNSLLAVNLGTYRTAVQIITGSDHTCALLDNGSVKCWGSNGNGQLGQGHTINLGDDPGEMGDPLPKIDLGTNRTAVQIAGSSSFTCAILDDGSVKCWGQNSNGQLGQNKTSNIGDLPGQMGDSLLRIDLGTNRKAIQISAGELHTCALLNNGSVKCWGDNSNGQLGQGNTSSVGITTGQMGDSLPEIDLGTNKKAIQISASGNHTCTILNNGSVKCWGINTQGQLGQGNTSEIGSSAGQMGDSLIPILLGTNLTATQIITSYEHTCATLDTGSVKCWGRNSNGQLGQGHVIKLGDNAGEMGNSLPAINLGTNRTVLQISTYGYHTCAVLDNRSMKCWGYNSDGQLGQGNTLQLGSSPGQMGDNLKSINLGTTK